MSIQPFDRERFDELVQKVQAAKAGGAIDLSMEEDLSIGIMNLVSLEEHFFFTAEKTGKPEYFDLLREVREERKALLARMIDRHEGETWCITKHLLAATMRIMEVGTKFNGEGKKEEAKEMFDRAYRIYSLFWGLRLKLIDLGEVKKIPDNALNVHDTSNHSPAAKATTEGGDGSKAWSTEDIVSKLVDCCKE